MVESEAKKRQGDQTPEWTRRRYQRRPTPDNRGRRRPRKGH